ncbi:hypothetical protein D3C81_2211590 [compost metagenome]
MEFNFQSFLREAVTFAYRTDGFDIGHELQIRDNDAITRAMLAPGAVRMGKTEINRLITALHRLRL